MSIANVTSPIAIVEDLMGCALNKVALNDKMVKVIKITKRGIYIYSNLSYDKNTCAPIISDETTILQDENGTLPLDEIEKYITARPRIKFITYQKQRGGVRILQRNTTSTPYSPNNESESVFDSAQYLVIRDLFPSESAGGKKLKDHYKLRQDFVKLDAKHFLLDYQFKSAEDKIAYTLLMNDYSEGIYDNTTGLLYGIDAKDNRIPLDTILEDATPGAKCFSFTELGVRLEVSSVSSKATLSNGIRSKRYTIPTIDVNKNMVEHFKDVRNNTKGIILVNRTLPEDLINTIYYYNSLADDKELNSTKLLDVLVLEREFYNCYNPYLMLEPIRERTSNEVVDIPAIEARIKQEALRVGYSVTIIRGVGEVTEDVVTAADTGLVYVIDDFVSISDVVNKLENIKVATPLFMSKVIGIMDIKKYTYFKMNQTVRSIIVNRDLAAKKLITTSIFTYEGEYKNFNSFIMDILRDETTDKLNIRSKGIHVVRTDGKKEDYFTSISFNNMLLFFAGLFEDEDVYSKLKDNSLVNVSIKVDNNSYRIGAYMEDMDINITIKKLNDTVLSNEKCPNLDIFDKVFVEGNNINYILKGFSDINLNEVVYTQIDRLTRAEAKVLLIDTDYSINADSLPTDSSKYLEVLHTCDAKTIFDVVNARKPLVLIGHKVQDKALLKTIYDVAPLVSNIIITSKFKAFNSIFINYISENIPKNQFEYYTNKEVFIGNEEGEFLSSKIENLKEMI